MAAWGVECFLSHMHEVQAAGQFYGSPVYFQEPLVCRGFLMTMCFQITNSQRQATDALQMLTFSRSCLGITDIHNNLLYNQRNTRLGLRRSCRGSLPPLKGCEHTDTVPTGACDLGKVRHI